MLNISIFLSKLNWSIVFWYSVSKSFLKLVWYPSIRYLVFHLIPQCSIEQPTSIKKLPQYLITKLQLSNDILMVVVERRNNVYMNCYRDFAFAKKEKLCKTIKKGCQIKPFPKNECILGIDRWDKFYGTLLYMNECINCIATLVPKPFMAKNADSWYETTVNFIFVKIYIAYSIYMAISIMQ